jgi:hypothetical protein
MKSHLKKKSKIISIAAIALLLVIFATLYYRNIQIEKAKAEEAKLDIERKEVSKKMREGGRLLAEQLRKNPIVMPDDALAAEEKTDVDEFAQIKLWQATPPKEREKLQSNQKQ